jgi:TrmH family RNA methyltransferase
VSLQAPVLVLVEPQDVVNIGSAVRVAKNFALSQVRLVAPAIFDPYRIEGIAHSTADYVDSISIHNTLQEAIEDCVYVVALTARERAAKRTVIRPGAGAAELMARADRGTVAIVAGREDKGLTNDELDRCHALVTIPTNPAYRSLNLAQAVAIMCYEIRLAAGGERQPLKPPRKLVGAPESGLLERLFADWERALWGIDFFKTRQAERVMRSFREIIYRADLDGREAALIRAMGIEVVRFLERSGVEVPPLDHPPVPD